MPRRHTIVDLFAGIAGVSAGFFGTGRFTPKLFIDNDQDAKKAFELNYPRLKKSFVCKDISKISANDILHKIGSRPKGIVGCPPCQGLSDVGLRRHVDNRNHLVDDYFRLIRSLRPKFFVMENVPGVLSYTRFQKQLKRTSRTFNIWAGVLNAAHYGVPQTRQRAIIIGYQKSLGVMPTPPVATHCGSRKLFAYDLQKFVSPIKERHWKNIFGKHTRLEKRETDHIRKLDRSIPLVTCIDALSDLPKASREPLRLRYGSGPKTKYQALMRGRKRTVENHAQWNHGRELIDAMRKLKAGESPLSKIGRDNYPYFSQAYAKLHPRGLARTVTTNFHNAGAGRFWHYKAQRTLTIREAARLQSFPDRFRFPTDLPKTVQERLLGNAFPPLLARALANHIYKEIGKLI